MLLLDLITVIRYYQGAQNDGKCLNFDSVLKFADCNCVVSSCCAVIISVYVSFPHCGTIPLCMQSFSKLKTLHRLDRPSKVFQGFCSNESCNVPHVSHAIVTVVITCACRRQLFVSSEGRITQSDIPLHYAYSLYFFIYLSRASAFINLLN